VKNPYEGNMETGYLPKGIPQRKGTLKDRHKTFHRNFIHNDHKLETIQISVNIRMDKLWHSHTMEYDTEATTTWIILADIMLNKNTKECT
jgi:hypothetical protein